MGLLWSVRPPVLLPCFILLISLSVPVEATCKHTDISRESNDAPVIVAIGSQYPFSENCGFLMKYSNTSGQLDCSKPITITISGGVFPCVYHANGEDEIFGTDSAYSCSCQWEQCIDDVKAAIGKLGDGRADCLTAVKEAFDKERKASDKADEERADKMDYYF